MLPCQHDSPLRSAIQFAHYFEATTPAQAGVVISEPAKHASHCIHRLLAAAPPDYMRLQSFACRSCLRWILADVWMPTSQASRVNSPTYLAPSWTCRKTVRIGRLPVSKTP